jgi:predicted SnoaL-like aldol condensation-catalyzing enzyme
MPRVLMVAGLLVIALASGVTHTSRDSARAQEATPTAECPPMSEEQNAALARRFLEDAIGGHDANVLHEIMAPQVAYHAAAGTDVDTVEEVITLISGTITAFPDVHYTIDRTITDGDLVAFIWRAEGTNTGSLQGRPPTGKHAAWTGINAFRVECG